MALPSDERNRSSCIRDNYLVYEIKSMERATFERLVERLRGGEQMAASPFEVPAALYQSREQLEAERPLFALPRIATLSSAIPAGGVAPYDEAGLSAILARGQDGVLRAFANACRHRATRLVDAPCAAKAMVCPYHGWTYDLAGTLIHAPHASMFGAACEKRDLRPISVAERDGLVWIGGEQIREHLGGLDADLRALRFDDHVVWRTATVTRRCNWKLVIEAFLDGYHIRVLHRDSIYRFFLDAMSLAEPVGPHIRAISARRTLREAPTSLDGVELRLLATPSFTVFPATTIIAHPDFISIIVLSPTSAGTTEWRHTMVVPASRAGDAEHWDKSWELIEGSVFQREDLWVCEQIQRGLESGTDDPLLFGALETPIAWFHAAIEARATPSMT
ncbi:MAG: aromatic ring-hydroxylating oxygenase subunit alpha [Kofleriaceae bacterium]